MTLCGFCVRGLRERRRWQSWQTADRKVDTAGLTGELLVNGMVEVSVQRSWSACCWEIKEVEAFREDTSVSAKVEINMTLRRNREVLKREFTQQCVPIEIEDLVKLRDICVCGMGGGHSGGFAVSGDQSILDGRLPDGLDALLYGTRKHTANWPYLFA